MGDRVQLELSPTQISTVTVRAKRAEDRVVGDSRITYQLTMTDGTVYNGGEWVAQNRLLNLP